MDKLFITILNMSLTGVFVITAICVARLPLKKAPKIISYCLWAVAGFRLVFPYSIQSIFSLIPFKAQPVPQDIATQAVPHIDSGISFLNNAVSSILPAAAAGASVNPLQIWTIIGEWVWVAGAAVLLFYGIVSFFILKRKMSEAAHIEANIYEAGNINSPFVLGIFKPHIYLPVGLSKQERSYIILHERTHIKRYDHMVKFAAYFVLCLHWFNPLAWVAFLLMGMDMEMSCDERVLKEIGGEIKKDYSLSLLSLAAERHVIGGSPLAFSEGGLKARIKNVLNFKRPSRVITVMSVVLVTVLSVGFAVNKASDTISMNAWNLYHFPDERFEQVFFKCNDSSYNPEYFVISAQLMNNQNIPGLTCDAYFTLVKQDGDKWERVPFTDGTAFDLTAWQLDNGMSFTYSIRPEMLIRALDEGNYRIVTEVWYPADRASALGGTLSQDSPAFYNAAKHTVWADFVIDKNAPKQKAYEFYIPSSLPGKTYSLKNPTEKQRFDRLNFINLYSDGTARLMVPLISSYRLPDCTYAFEDGELLILAASGVKNGEVIARFTVEDDNTLIFKSSTVPLFADEGAQYVSVHFSAVPTTTFAPQKWVDFYHDEELWFTSTYDLMLDEFPGVIFSWTSGKVTATDSNGMKDLFTGMPIWNAYLADLNGDGLPELCATVSFGSGLIDTRVIVYDYANDTGYDLSDRGYYDYILSLEDNNLIVTQAEYFKDDVRATGSMAIMDGELVTFGLDRTLPESPETKSPEENLSSTEG